MMDTVKHQSHHYAEVPLVINSTHLQTAVLGGQGKIWLNWKKWYRCIMYILHITTSENSKNNWLTPSILCSLCHLTRSSPLIPWKGGRLGPCWICQCVRLQSLWYEYTLIWVLVLVPLWVICMSMRQFTVTHISRNTCNLVRIKNLVKYTRL